MCSNASTCRRTLRTPKHGLKEGHVLLSKRALLRCWKFEGEGGSSAARVLIRLSSTGVVTLGDQSVCSVYIILIVLLWAHGTFQQQFSQFFQIPGIPNQAQSDSFHFPPILSHSKIKPLWQVWSFVYIMHVMWKGIHTSMADCCFLQLLLLRLGRKNQYVHVCVNLSLCFANRVKESQISVNW